MIFINEIRNRQFRIKEWHLCGNWNYRLAIIGSFGFALFDEKIVRAYQHRSHPILNSLKIPRRFHRAYSAIGEFYLSNK